MCTSQLPCCVINNMISDTIQIPCPKDITDEQLEALQESGDASHYRVPLSLGEPHTVTDNSK